jgi:ribosomal-protein-serine acetyltransferase
LLKLTAVLSFSIDGRHSLRLLEEADADELYAVIERNREFLSEWMPWAATQTPEDTLAYIRRSRQQLADNLGFQLAILAEDGIVGVIGFPRLDWDNRSASIGYWIAESAQGQGTVTEAVRALADHAFGTWRLNRLEIRAGVDNHRSRAIPARLGFTEEGVRREAELVRGRYIDHAVYAMLAADWGTASE